MFRLIKNLIQYLKTKNEKKIEIIVLGLDNAGKTTFLTNLNTNLSSLESGQGDVVPTIGFDSLSIERKGYSINFFDLGGNSSFRGIWSKYFAEVHGLIYVIDSSESDERLKESKAVLIEALSNAKLAGKPILIVANKQDLPTSRDSSVISSFLSLDTSLPSPFKHKIIQTRSKWVTASLNSPQIDINIQSGIDWLMGSIESVMESLSIKIEADLEIQRQEEAAEAAARKERVRKLREEREAERLREEGQAAQNSSSKSEGKGGGIDDKKEDEGTEIHVTPIKPLAGSIIGSSKSELNTSVISPARVATQLSDSKTHIIDVEPEKVEHPNAVFR